MMNLDSGDRVKYQCPKCQSPLVNDESKCGDCGWEFSSSTPPGRITAADSATRARQFGRGMTLVTIGFLALAMLLLTEGNGVIPVVLLIAVALFYPGYTLIGLAVLRD